MEVRRGKLVHVLISFAGVYIDKLTADWLRLQTNLFMDRFSPGISIDAKAPEALVTDTEGRNARSCRSELVTLGLAACDPYQCRT